MIGRFCHLFVHALSSLQVANAQCMTLRSLAPCLRAAREKHRFAAGKKTSERKKNTFGSRKKTPCSGKKLFPQREKRQQKCRFAAGKIQSSRKNTLQQHKSTFAAEKMHFGGSGKKPSEAGKNLVRGKKKPAEAGKNQQQRKSSFATQKVAATEKIHFRNGKKQQPISTCMPWFVNTAHSSRRHMRPPKSTPHAAKVFRKHRTQPQEFPAVPPQLTSELLHSWDRMPRQSKIKTFSLFFHAFLLGRTLFPINLRHRRFQLAWQKKWDRYDWSGDGTST